MSVIEAPSETLEKILIIDDESLILNALKATLEREGYEVFIASTGDEALDIINSQSLAIVICDQLMPGINGLDILMKCKELRPHTLRVLLTANSDQNTAINAINKAEVTQFIQKPWDDQHLRQTVKSLVEKYRLMRENQTLHNLIVIQHRELAKAHSALREEIELGGKIQKTLLQGKVPLDLPGIKINAHTTPTYEIDGEFFEFYRPVKHVIDIVVGDVMGKGIPAALIGNAVKTQIQRFAVPTDRHIIYSQENAWQDDPALPEEIMQSVHAEIVPQLIQLEYFVSLFYGRLNLHKRTFSFIDCGFAKPIHFQRQKRKSVFLKGDNLPLGLVEKETYRAHHVNFSDGDFLVLYSDGVSQAKSPSGETFGENRIQMLVERHCEKEAEILSQILKKSVMDFMQKEVPEDDLTLIVTKFIDCHMSMVSPPRQGQFSSDLSQLQAAREFIHRTCLNIPGNAIRLTQELQLAINEVFCNIVQHGYNGRPGGSIMIQGHCEKDGVVLEVADQGKSFDPFVMLEPSLLGDQENGFGWFMIRRLASRMEYIPKKSESGWNRLRIFKYYNFEEENMDIKTHQQDGIWTITPEADALDARDASEFKEKVIAFIHENNVLYLIFDLSRLQFVDSSGLGSLLSVLRVLHTKGGDLKLAGMNKPVKAMFELVSMHKIFEIFPSTGDAVRSFQQMKINKP